MHILEVVEMNMIVGSSSFILKIWSSSFTYKPDFGRRKIISRHQCPLFRLPLFHGGKEEGGRRQEGTLNDK